MSLHRRSLVRPLLATLAVTSLALSPAGCGDDESPGERAEQGLEQAEAGIDQADAAADELKDEVEALEDRVDAHREAIRELAQRQAGLLESELSLARQRVANLPAEQERAVQPTLDETASAITAAREAARGLADAGPDAAADAADTFSERFEAAREQLADLDERLRPDTAAE